MKSSSGEHFIALDHVRALAAFIVFSWHFLHFRNGTPVPFEFLPAVFPMAIFDEGHTGVALFMTLSGYLFAKLLENKRIAFLPFLWNRALRLLPLLVFVVIIVGIQHHQHGRSLSNYMLGIARGAIYPSLPNGGWSITVEFHFYLVLPLLLWLLRRSPFLPIILVVSAIAFRTYLHRVDGEVQWFSYWTIIGRIDQFVIGILAFHFRHHLEGQHFRMLIIALSFFAFWWIFDRAGGFFKMPTYPSPSRLWIGIPTIEALTYGSAIAWYETSFTHRVGIVSRTIARFGEYSYSIYLLHFFFVFSAARFINESVMDISNFYIAMAWALVSFSLMAIPCYLSYRIIEEPFMKFRKKYILHKAPQP